MATRRDLERVIAYKRQLEAEGYPVRRLTIDGKRMDVEFGTQDGPDEYDLTDMRR